jgi:hypothetical protein
MTIFNVHIYREMRLVYGGIEANSHEEAAAIARDKPTDDADSIDDCDGETLAALVDVQGDEEYRQSRTIDFEEERLRKAAPKMLAALEMASNYLGDDLDQSDETEVRVFTAIRAAIAEATGLRLSSEPPPTAGYFVGASGRRYGYAEIAGRIGAEAPHTLGQHIFVQLEAIGLLEEMQNGTTPCGLPLTFASALPPSDPPTTLKLTRELADRMFHPSRDVVYGPHSFYSAENDSEVEWTHPDEHYVISFNRASETFTGRYYDWDDEKQDWVDTEPMTAEQIRECIERNRLLFAR